MVRPSMRKREHQAQGKFHRPLEVYTAIHKHSRVKSAEEPPYTSKSTATVYSVYLKYEIYGRLPKNLSL